LVEKKTRRAWKKGGEGEVGRERGLKDGERASDENGGKREGKGKKGMQPGEL